MRPATEAARTTPLGTTPAPAGAAEPAPAEAAREGWRRQLPVALLLVALVAALLLPWIRADPPAGLSWSNSPYTDEGLYLEPARNRVLFGRFGTDQYDHSLTEGAFAAVTAAEFAVTRPSVVAGRALSVVSLCGAVALLVLGLARPLGRRVALLAGLLLAGNELLLLYGRLAVAEPFVVFLLVAAFILVIQALDRGSVAAGIGAGLVVALALSSKLTALVPAVAMLGIPLLFALVRRDRQALRVIAAAVGALAAGAAAWWLIIGRPNESRLRVAIATLDPVGRNHYPTSVAGALHRVAAYVTGGSDQAIGRNTSLLLAVAVGVIVLAAMARRLSNARRVAAASALAWGVGTWLAVALNDYAPNRFMITALPGLVVFAAIGLDELATAVTGGRPLSQRWRTSAAVVLGLLVALPGIIGYLSVVTPSFGTHELASDENAVAAALPRHAVVYGVYAPIMAFSSDARTIVPWVPGRVNMRDPVRRYGVDYVITDAGGGPALQAVAPHGLGGATLVARVRWGPHVLRLYRLPAHANAGS